MKISTKLLIIVVLTIFEISVTLWAVFELSKGATFHQLNSLHLKYSAELATDVLALEKGKQVAVDDFRSTLKNIRRQPVECLNQVNALNKFIMQQIGTLDALALCEKDIQDADQALAMLAMFERGKISEVMLQKELENYVQVFNLNSVLFEKPITKTVDFVVKVMIPLVIVISCFNIFFIAFMSRNITRSISGVIKLLNNKSDATDLESKIKRHVSGEIKTLLQVASARIEDDILNTQNNKKLAAIVDKRTALLTRANEELAQFAYRTSHDLTSPLASSKSLLKFIQQDLKNGHMQEANINLEKMYTLLEKQEKLVQNILSLTKADLHQGEAEVIDFEAILAEIKVRLDGVFTDNQCTFTYHLKVRDKVVAERARIIQVLENLISNAAKYSDPNKADSFATLTVSEQGAQLRIEVSDNGVGLPQSCSEDIYKMFTRFHPKMSFGSGLGMAIVKKHIEFLQGHIEFESSAQGTKFTVLIPKESKV